MVLILSSIFKSCIRYILLFTVVVVPSYMRLLKYMRIVASCSSVFRGLIPEHSYTTVVEIRQGEIGPNEHRLPRDTGPSNFCCQGSSSMVLY